MAISSIIYIYWYKTQEAAPVCLFDGQKVPIAFIYFGKNKRKAIQLN